MGVALVLPVSGPYVGTWATAADPSTPLALGTQNDDGFILSCTIQGQEVNATDAWGMTLVEAIYRGQNWRLRFTGIEWNKVGLLALLQMFGSSTLPFSPTLTPGTSGTPPANIGDRWVKYCSTLVLTAILSSPPPTSPSSLTSLNAGLAPNSQSSSMMTSKLREMPLEMVLFPYTKLVSLQNLVVPFTTT
jgi:hypothetical protein